MKSTKLLESMRSPQSMGAQYFLGLLEFLFPKPAALVLEHRGLRVLSTMVGYFKLVQSESGGEHIAILFLGALLKSY